jgi:MFS family permease
MPDPYVLTLPLLVVIHMLAGMSTAGVTLCSGNVAMKLAPKGQATAFLATNALVSGVAATLAPLCGGIAADWLASERLNLQFQWSSAATNSPRMSVSALDLAGLDFVFIAAVLGGLYALHRLLAVREEGEVDDEVVSAALGNEVRKAVRHISNVAGLRHLTHFPYHVLRTIAGTLAEKNDEASPPLPDERGS